MQLLCVGDVAIARVPPRAQRWSFPGGGPRDDNTRILFNWELPSGAQANPLPRSSGPRILGDQAALPLIAGWAPGFAALANNHILDAGVDGLHETRGNLQPLGFAPFGAGGSPDEIQAPAIWDGPEGRLGILNWVFAETHPDWLATPGPNCWPGIEEAGRALGALKQQVDWVLVVPHWGDEYFPYPATEDRATARRLIEAGADLIIGHHPHVVRGWEKILGKPVFYSLGNFFFSEAWDAQGALAFRPAPRNREALVLRVTLQRGRAPLVEPLSFWQGRSSTAPDPLNRAVRRMKKVSQVLADRTGPDYAAWYDRRRCRFARWDYRLHFSPWEKGWRGILGYPLAVLKRGRARRAPSR